MTPETPLAPFNGTGKFATREANTNQPTVSHFFTRNGTVRHRRCEGQGKSRDFFNRFKDLAAIFNANFAQGKPWKKKQIAMGLKVKSYERRGGAAHPQEPTYCFY
jgi:hypothetical protein